MNLLITGSNGQLGSELKALESEFASLTFFYTDIDTLDITSYKLLDDYITQNKIDTIINCAAYTAVDKAEDEYKTAELVNSKSVYNLAKISEKHSLYLIHISTDYVFDGSKNTPYKETDQTNPNSNYGKTKLMGERSIKQFDINWMIIRTSWLYSSFGNNFVKTMLYLSKKNKEIKVVFDQVGSPTYAKNLAHAILQIVSQINFYPQEFIKGVYHYSNEGVCSWYDFANEIFKQKNIKCDVIPVLSNAFPTKAKRPAYSVLSKEKIKKAYNIKIPHWTAGLSECLSKII
ncbi:MAG: dTDP-4-dehydrorhamnose reductase [Chlorobi bacterium]|nr:dTDP-4-dehydrorhamnose reductase [Chlorobiota bacterium]